MKCSGCILSDPQTMQIVPPAARFEKIAFNTSSSFFVFLDQFHRQILLFKISSIIVIRTRASIELIEHINENISMTRLRFTKTSEFDVFISFFCHRDEMSYFFHEFFVFVHSPF